MSETLKVHEDYECLNIERDGAVVIVTIDRPKVLNALNTLTIRELTRAIVILSDDASVRVVILTGAGDRAFAAGADISELAALARPVAGVELARAGQGLTLALERARPVVIAAVNGFALGGGCEVAMACDIRIASDRAKFGQPEVNLGLMPAYGGSQRTTRLVGRGTAMLMCLTAEMIDAAEALRIGLVERVVPAADLMTEARRVATLIASKAPLAIAATKSAIREGASIAIEPALELEALHFGTLVATADFAEGTRAFLDKRPPAFSGT